MITSPNCVIGSNDLHDGSMIGIILAGGYGKRLWPLTYDRPKVLLPLAGRPVLDYIAEKLTALNPPINRVIVSTNLRFQPQFQEWLQAKEYRNVELLPDRSRSEEEKPGAIGALAEIAEETDGDLLVAAADSLFADDLRGLIDLFREKAAPVVALYRAINLEEVMRGSEVTLDDQGRILEFVEKPTEPKKTLVGGCIYAFPHRIHRRLEEYSGLRLPRDEPGRFIEWLCKQEDVYGCMLRDYVWDIGTLESYKAADEYFSRKALAAT